MGFDKEIKMFHSIRAVKLIFNEPFSTEDMKSTLGIITSMLDLNIPFAFYVDTRNANKPPLNAASILLKWMVANKQKFKKNLICSCVIFGNTTTNNLISKIIKGVFVIQPTVSPNLLINDYEKGEKWVEEMILKFKNKTNN